MLFCSTACLLHHSRCVCVCVQSDILGTEGSCCWPTCSHLSSAGSCRISAAAAAHKAGLCNPSWVDTRSRGNRERQRRLILPSSLILHWLSFMNTYLHAWHTHTHLLHELYAGGKTNGHIQVTEQKTSAAHNFTCRWQIFKPVFLQQHAKHVCKCDQGRNSWAACLLHFSQIFWMW